MPGTSLIFSPDTPAFAHIRSVENWYQIALIADNTSHLRHFMVRSQIAQFEALREANTQLAQTNAGIAGIERGLGDLSSAVQQGFGDLTYAMQRGFDALGGQIADLGYAVEQGFTALAAEMQRQNTVMVEIARLLSTKLEGEAREIRNSALAAVKEGCSPEAFDQEGSLREALQLFRVTVEHPMGVRDYVAWFNIGWLLWKLDADLPAAERAFATSVRQSMEKKDAYHAMAARHLAYVRYLQKNNEGAQQGIRLALQAAEGDPENLATLLLVAAQAGNADEVARTFRKLVAEHPGRLAACLAEPELAPYTQQLQPVIDSLVQGARARVRAAIAEINAMLDEARRMAEAVSRPSLLCAATTQKAREIADRVGKTNIDTADWPTMHGLVGEVGRVTKAVETDIRPVSAWVRALQGIAWVEVPAGDFFYGERKERRRLPAFRIMQTPVTVRLYRAYCEAAGVAMPSEPAWDWLDDHPIVNVSWNDAQAFCEWTGLALPTEEQWEKAARGTDGREFPWGDRFDAGKCVCSVSPANAGSTAPVGSKPEGASPYGCLDMAGNVWEWCQDWYDGAQTSRVMRGGAWLSNREDSFRASYRNRCNPDCGSYIDGFRCVLPEGSS